MVLVVFADMSLHAALEQTNSSTARVELFFQRFIYLCNFEPLFLGALGPLSGS